MSSSQRAQDIYVALLQPKGHGYPLWLPEPSDDLPPVYRRDGTQIGDLGYLDEDGGFVYLFNVGKAFHDPVNVGRTPPDFVPLSRIHEPTNQHLRLRRYGNDKPFEATSSEIKSVGGGISAEASCITTVAPSAGLAFKLDFTSSSTEAAYLVLPDGGKQSEYKYPDELEQYAIDHAHDWYRHFNGQGRQIRNGMLYLVTGCSKCRSWANACFSHTAESRAVSLNLSVAGGGANVNGTLYYKWEVQSDSPVHHRSYPEPPALIPHALIPHALVAAALVLLAFIALALIPPALIAAALTAAAVLLCRYPKLQNLPEAAENQTIFLRGYSISVSEKVSLKLRKEKKVKLFEKPPQDASIPYRPAQQSSTTPATGTTQGHGARMERGTTRPLNFNDSGSSYDEYSGSGVSEDGSETDTSMMDVPYGHTTMQAGALVQRLPGWGKIVNPSALINKHILDTYPGATIALTHDDFEWTGVEDNLRNPLNVMDLAKYAIDNILVSINRSETTPNAWVAKRRNTNLGVGTFARHADIYFRGTPKGTLSAFIETGQAESSIEVPKQRSYSGRSPVISSRLADTPCATLGVQGVLDLLNAILGTSHTLHTAHSSSKSTASPAPSSAASVQDQLSLLSILEDFIVRNDDFGTAYALLRPVWNTKNPSNIQDKLRRLEETDSKRQQKARVGNRIVSPYLRPRRVWDLYSNRVVPSWITYKTPTPISHAWVDEKDREDVRTPINGKEWPVPIPKEADLNLIRIEMLNLGAEYAWLDVLCLRQKEEGGLREDLRVEEWRLDVPTAGHVYKSDVSEHKKVVIYLSGLGRPLKLKDGDLDSDRNWFRRAWTLHEIGDERTIAGDTPDGPMHAQQIDDGNYETALLTRFHKELHSVKRHPDQIFAILGDMQKRVSTNPVDRVAGLAFLLRPFKIPAYYERESLENAWTALVNTMYPWIRACFLFVYPGVGVGGKKWRPTWNQVMMEPLPKDVDRFHVNVQHDDKTDEDWFDRRCIEKGYVRGFDVGSAEGCDRCGELVVKAADVIAHTFKIRVTHQFLIPEDTYTLLGDTSLSYWAIGRRLPGQKFEKVSVIMMDNRDEAYILRDLSLARSRNILV